MTRVRSFRPHRVRSTACGKTCFANDFIWETRIRKVHCSVEVRTFSWCPTGLCTLLLRSSAYLKTRADAVAPCLTNDFNSWVSCLNRSASTCPKASPGPGHQQAAGTLARLPSWPCFQQPCFGSLAADCERAQVRPAPGNTGAFAVVGHDIMYLFPAEFDMVICSGAWAVRGGHRCHRSVCTAGQPSSCVALLSSAHAWPGIVWKVWT